MELSDKNRTQFLECFIPGFTDPDGFCFFGARRFSSKGISFLISGQTGGTILLTDQLAENIVQGKTSGDLKFKLIQRGLGKIYNSREAVTAKEQPLPCYFLIDLTLNCVLRCCYCFRHLTNGKGTISENTLNEICCYILDYCKKHSLRNISIQAWGGEPTLAWQRIMQILRFFEGSGVKAAICIETCGATLTEDMVRTVKKYDMRIGVSIDGPPDIHNFQRPFASGEGSFQAVKNGLALLRSNGINDFSSITVITRKSVGRIREIIEYFTGELKLRQFKFNLVKCHPGMKEDDLGVTVDETAVFAREMFRTMVQAHREGFRAVETNIRIRILNLLTHRPSSICLSRGCHGGRKLISISSTGDIYTCDLSDAGDKPFGNIKDGRDLVELLTEAAKTHPFFQKREEASCANCPWFFFCRGGCTSSLRFSLGHYTKDIDKCECAYNNVIYREIIRLLIEDPDLVYSLAGEFPIGDENDESGWKG